MPVKPSQWLSPQEVKRLVESTRDWAATDLAAHRRQGVLAWALVDTALSTGLRVGEMAILTCGDLRPENPSLIVHRLKKAGGPRRDEILIGRDLAEHLDEWLTYKRGRREPSGPGDVLFRSIRGPYRPGGLALVWRQAVSRARLPRAYSIHAARHTFATHLLHQCHDIVIVQHWLGHSSPTVTANAYTGVWPEDKLKAVNGMYRE